MAAVTGRDKVWSAALAALAGKKNKWRGIQLAEVKRLIDDPPSDDTIRRTLAAMTELEYLSSKHNSPKYRAGPKFDDLRGGS